MTKKITVLLSSILMVALALYVVLSFFKTTFKTPNVTVNVCEWKDDKVAATSITIDDNNEQDLPFWQKMASQFNVKFTWFLITEAADSLNVTCWDCFQKLANEGHSIQAHDDRNWYANEAEQQLNPTPDEYFKRLQKTKTTINAHITHNQCETYAYPWGQGNSEVAKKCYIACRGVMGLLNKRDSIHYFNVNSISSPHIIKDTTAMKKYVLPVIDSLHNLYGKSYYKGWLSVHFHSVANKEEQAKTIQFLRFLNGLKNKIWIATFPQVVKYAKEYDSHQVHIEKVSNQEVIFSITHSLDKTVYNEPLTIKATIPSSWKKIKLLHNQNEINYTIAQSNSKKYRYIVFTIPPNQGSVTIKQYD